MNLNWIRKRESLDRNTKYLNITISKTGKSVINSVRVEKFQFPKNCKVKGDVINSIAVNKAPKLSLQTILPNRKEDE